MSAEAVAMCEGLVYGKSARTTPRFCQRRASWLVRFRLPVEKGADRDAREEHTRRVCVWHSYRGSLPENASNISVERIRDRGTP